MNHNDEYMIKLAERQKINMKHIFSKVLTAEEIQTELAKGKTKQGLQHAIDNNLPVLIIKNSGLNKFSDETVRLSKNLKEMMQGKSDE